MDDTFFSIIGAGIGGAVFMLTILALAVMCFVYSEKREELAIKREAGHRISAVISGEQDLSTEGMLRQNVT